MSVRDKGIEDLRIVQDSPTMLHDSGDCNKIQNLAVIHHMAIRQIHLHVTSTSIPLPTPLQKLIGWKGLTCMLNPSRLRICISATQIASLISHQTDACAGGG